MEQINTDQSSTRENKAAHAASLATFDHAAAHREGWGLSDYGRRKDGTRRVQLQKLELAASWRSQLRRRQGRLDACRDKSARRIKAPH